MSTFYVQSHYLWALLFIWKSIKRPIGLCLYLTFIATVSFSRHLTVYKCRVIISKKIWCHSFYAQYSLGPENAVKFILCPKIPFWFLWGLKELLFMPTVLWRFSQTAKWSRDTESIFAAFSLRLLCAGQKLNDVIFHVTLFARLRSW